MPFSHGMPPRGPALPCPEEERRGRENCLPFPPGHTGMQGERVGRLPMASTRALLKAQLSSARRRLLPRVISSPGS